MSVFSHSRIETFETCPKKYEFNYILKMPRGPAGVEAFMGNRVHEALEWLYAEVRSCRLPDEEQLVERYAAAWDAEWTDDVRIVRADRTAQDYRSVGEKALRLYHRRHHPFDADTTVGLELRISLALDDDHEIIGYVDRVARVADGVWEIHDYKTSSSLMTQAKADSDRQLALYELAIRAMYPDVREVTLVWHYLAFDQEVRSTRTAQQRSDLEDRVLAAVLRLEAQTSFPTKVSNLCDWCDYKAECPAWKHLYATEDPGTDADAQEPAAELVDEYLRISDELSLLKARQDELRDRIAQRAAADGIDRLFGADGSLKVFRYESVTLPDSKDPRRSALEARLREMGLWERFSALAPYALSRAVGDGALDADQLAAIEPYVTRAAGVKLYPGKRG